MTRLYDRAVAHKANVVIIGGGIIGSSVAYHLADMGVEGIVLLEKGSLADNDGSTSHAPGGLRTLTVSKFFTKLGIASRQVYDQLPLAIPGQEQFFRTGFVQAASTSERFDSYKRIQEVGLSLGVPSQLLSPDETAEASPSDRSFDDRRRDDVADLGSDQDQPGRQIDAERRRGHRPSRRSMRTPR